MSSTIMNPDLTAIRAALEQHRGTLISLEDAFFAASLNSRLKIGLHCLTAHALFVINAGTGGRPKKTVTRDGFSGAGFEGWLESEVPWLKKPTAYKYMTALRGLGLDDSATEKQIDSALETARAMAAKGDAITLRSLCEAAAEPFRIEPPAPHAEQQEFEFLKTQLTHYREQSESLLGNLDALKGIPAMHKAACARAYDTLCQLTGTQWGPTDEPDELASIDPDNISL